MKRYIKNILAIVLMLISCHFNMKSQQVSEKDMLFFIGKDSVPVEILGYFYSAESPLFTATKTPNFIVASRNSRFVMGIGGYILVRASYDFDGISNGNDFQTYNIPVPNKGNPSSRFAIDASATRLFTRVFYNHSKWGQIMGYIESDFLGNSRTLRLRQAFIKIRNLTVGQTTSTFIDVGAFGPSLDQNGSIVASYQRNPLIRYSGKIGGGFSFAAALEYPAYTGTNLPVSQPQSQYSANPSFPDVPVYVKYGWLANHLQLTGLLRELTYRNNIKNDYCNVFGYGVKLSGKIWLSPKINSFFHGVYGKGISAYLLDVAGVGLDLISDPSRPGKMFTPEGMALFGGATYYFNKKLYSTLNYAYTRIYLKNSLVSYDGFDASQFYEYAQAASVNLIWEFIPSAYCGIEYWWGQRTNYSGISGHANRIYTSIRYNF